MYERRQNSTCPFEHEDRVQQLQVAVVLGL